MCFSETLKRYRGQYNLTQQNVVDKLKKDFDFKSMSVISYHRWETGKVTPNINKQAKTLLLLGCKEELISLCKLSKRSQKFLDATIKRRWDTRRFGFDYCYDNTISKELTFKRINTIDELPPQALLLQNSIYKNQDKNIQLDIKKLLEECKSNFLLLSCHQEKLYGQMSFHVMKAIQLDNHLNKMSYDIVNTLESLSLKPDDDIVFLSSFHSTRKDVFIIFIKTLITELFKLERIPKYTFLRLHGSASNSLVTTQLMPRLVAKGGKKFPRVQHINTKYEWLGYLVPTHLILLGYGSILDCYNNLIVENCKTN